MMKLEDYKRYLENLSDIQQCACIVSAGYFKQHKNDKYVVVFTIGRSLKTCNELVQPVTKKYIGTLDELYTQLQHLCKGVKPRYIHTLFDKIITNRQKNVCIVVRKFIENFD